MISEAFSPGVHSSLHLMYEMAEHLRGRGHGMNVVTCAEVKPGGARLAVRPRSDSDLQDM